MPDDLAGLAAELVEELTERADECDDIDEQIAKLEKDVKTARKLASAYTQWHGDLVQAAKVFDCPMMVALPVSIPSHLQAQDDDDARAVPCAIARYR